jgi:hypothetical protein
MSLSDKSTPDWFDWPPKDFIAGLTNMLRGEIGKAQTAAEFMHSEQGLKTALPNGTEVDLLSIVITSLEQAQLLLDLAGKYSEEFDPKWGNQ